MRIRGAFSESGTDSQVAIGLRPSTLLTFHQALVRGKYRRLFSSSARPKKPGPKGPSESLIRAHRRGSNRAILDSGARDCAHGGEIATRIALGASGRHVFWLVTKAGLRLTLGGAAAKAITPWTPIAARTRGGGSKK